MALRIRLESRFLLFAVLGYAGAITASNLTPLQVSAFAATQGLSDAQIGAAAMCEILMLAFSTILATAIPMRGAIIVGILGPIAAAFGQAASIWIPSFLGLCIVRGLVGAGCGLSGALASRSIASSSASGPAFGLANAVSVIMIGSLLVGIPWLPMPDPSVRIFLPLAMLAGLTAAATWLSTGAFKESVHENTNVIEAKAIEFDPFYRTSALLLVAATLLIYVPIGGIWTFSVKFGTDLGMSERQASGLLIYAVVGGFIGGTVAAAVERAVGMLWLVVISALGCVLACVLVGAAHGPVSYAFAFALYSGVYQFAISSFQGVGTVMDRSGRLPAVLLGTTLVGYSIGSYLVGYLIEGNRRELIWVGGAISCAAALLPVLVSVRRIHGRARVSG